MLHYQKPFLARRRFFGALFVVTLILAVAACGLPTSGIDAAGQQTLMAVSVQATLNAQQSAQGMQATMDAQQATLVAQAAQSTLIAQQMTQVAQQAAPPTADLAATQVAQSVQATLAAAQPTQAPVVQTEAPAGTSGGASGGSGTGPTQDFESWTQTAEILLYEDMVNNVNTSRYVKDTLEAMGLPYDDVGSAKGWLKERLLSGGPGGKGYDLVIIAAEVKSGVQGEFFEYVNDALNMGSAVILEVWYLDSTAGGKASTLLMRCGLEYQRDWSVDNGTPVDRLVMFPLVSDSPLLHEPNDGVRFTKVSDYWLAEARRLGWGAVNLGDLLKLAPGSDATLVVGQLGTEDRSHGTVAVCEDGRMIWQTFSSHQLSRDTGMPVWENYIYNALKARYAYLNGQ